jgi:hypothetical protein
MILFQIGNLNLYKNIRGYNGEISEDTIKYDNKSSYRGGGRRNYANKTQIIKVDITGQSVSQHFLHAIRAMSERDEADGQIKCYFIERYSRIDQEYNPLSTNADTNKGVRVYFAYCYIDADTKNNEKLPDNDGVERSEYRVIFNIELVYTSIFEITQAYNTFYYDRLKIKPSNFYDNGLQYDSSLLYDQGVGQSLNSANDIRNNQLNLDKFYEAVTCCDIKRIPEDIIIIYYDTVIDPFLFGNRYVDSGIINKDIIGQRFNYDLENKNFFQAYLSNPSTSSNLGKKFVLPLNKDGAILIGGAYPNGSEPFIIGNMNKVTNTWTTNSIIQIFKAPFTNTPFTQPASGKIAIPPLLADANKVLGVNQKLELSVIGVKGINSSISLSFDGTTTPGDIPFLQKIKVIVFHPSKQKYHALMGDIFVTFTPQGFELSGDLTLTDLEPLLLRGTLIESSIYNETQEHFRLTPTYKTERFDPDFSDNLVFSSNIPLATNTMMMIQIYSLDENKTF